MNRYVGRGEDLGIPAEQVAAAEAVIEALKRVPGAAPVPAADADSAPSQQQQEQQPSSACEPGAAEQVRRARALEFGKALAQVMITVALHPQGSVNCCSLLFSICPQVTVAEMIVPYPGERWAC